MPPAILVRFLREHRSEWADCNVDPYSAAAVKIGPCSFPGSRMGSTGSQVTLPLAHTIEHEEASGAFHCFWDVTFTNSVIEIIETNGHSLFELVVVGGCQAGRCCPLR